MDEDDRDGHKNQSEHDDAPSNQTGGDEEESLLSSRTGPEQHPDDTTADDTRMTTTNNSHDETTQLLVAHKAQPEFEENGSTQTKEHSFTQLEDEKELLKEVDLEESNQHSFKWAVRNKRWQTRFSFILMLMIVNTISYTGIKPTFY